MKFLITPLFLCFVVTASAQQYGSPVTEDKATAATEIGTLESSQGLTVKIKGPVQEVCQVKGCWMTMAIDDTRQMRITFKDYGFFVPTDCSGKTAIVEGQLTSQTISVDDLKHLAEDAGKSDQEIAAITESRTELVFVADGVLFLPNLH